MAQGQLSSSLNLAQLLTRWSAQLNPFISNPLVNGQIINKVTLNLGTTVNVVNHKLGRKLIGWFIIGYVNPSGTHPAPGIIFDDQSNNPNPEKTLLLYNLDPSAPFGHTVTVNLYVF